MLELLNPSIPTQTPLFQHQYSTAQPFRHVVIDNFLEPAFCQQLIGEFPRFDPARAANEMGTTGRKAVFQEISILGAAFRRFDELMRSAEFLALVGRITGIDNLEYDPEYVGGGTHENLNGQDLDPHVDFNFQPGDASAPPLESHRVPEPGLGRKLGRVA